MGSRAAIGSVLGGRYRLVSVLGTGSMSTVYRAETDDGDLVAVKVLKRKVHNPQAATERLFREARVIARLDHPGCVRLLDWGVDVGQPFVVLELMEGEALNEGLKRWKTLEPPRAIAVMIEVCKVLAAAHELGVVHRDLKPGNIMLLSGREGPHVKVLDFGLARLTPKRSADETQPKELTRPGSTLGTPSYMAPEQVRGSQVDGRADVYACGVILYELLTGQLPIVGETAIDTMLRQAADPPRPILEVKPDLDPRLAEVIMRCLEKQLEARYPSADALREALEAFVSTSSSPDATTTFVRDDLPPSEQTSTVLRPSTKGDSGKGAPARTPSPKPVLPKPKAPPRTKRPPPPKGERREERKRADTDTDTKVVDGQEAEETRRHDRSELPEVSARSAPLPLPMPAMPKVRVTETAEPDREATKIHTRPEPDLSEMEVTIPAHDASSPALLGNDEHEMERTIPVTSLKPNDGPTKLHDMADWASTQKLRRVREEDLDLPDATAPLRIKVEGPPPSRPSHRGPPSSVPPPHAPASSSVRPPDPSLPHKRPLPPKNALPSMRRPEVSDAALAEVLSGIPSDERRWLLGAAVAGLAMAVGLALWLLL